MLRAAPIVALALFAVLAASCGGGSSPTEPTPNVLSVAGTWEGFWNETPPFGAEDIFVTMALTQIQGTNRVVGRVTFLGDTWDISGETTYESPGEGRFVWDDDETVCPVLSGDLDVSSNLNMSGLARLDTDGCPPSGVIDFQGGMQLRKRST